MNSRSNDGPHIIAIGLAALDHIWQVPRLPSSYLSKVQASSFLTKGGGMAATAAVAIARLGGNASFWGRAGNDSAGQVMKAELRDEGVDTGCFRLFDGAVSSVSGVFVDDMGERHISNFRGVALPDATDWLPLDAVRHATAVLSDPRWPNATVAAFTAARRAGVPTVLDADVADREIFERILPLTDHAIFSAPALASFAAPDEAVALKSITDRFGCRVSAVTRGESGVEWLEGEMHARLPAFTVAVVDTNGAGDVFHGAYAFAIASGMPVERAMAFASAAAALKCTRSDGRSGIPTFDDVTQLQRTVV